MSKQSCAQLVLSLVSMPTTPRKSSLGGTRRGPHKAHIPYRGDNPGVGKKTGIQVNHVDRDSDGFEPFENLMQQQADGVTPPHLVSKKRKKSMVLDDDFDEDGEQSMDIDSVSHYFIYLAPVLSIY